MTPVWATPFCTRHASSLFSWPCVWCSLLQHRWLELGFTKSSRRSRCRASFPNPAPRWVHRFAYGQRGPTPVDGRGGPPMEGNATSNEGQEDCRWTSFRERFVVEIECRVGGIKFHRRIQ